MGQSGHNLTDQKLKQACVTRSKPDERSDRERDCKKPRRESKRRIRAYWYHPRSPRRVVASSRLHAFPSLVSRNLFHSFAVDWICHLFTLAVSVDCTALWRRPTYSVAAPMVRFGV